MKNNKNNMNKKVLIIGMCVLLVGTLGFLIIDDKQEQIKITELKPLNEFSVYVIDYDNGKYKVLDSNKLNSELHPLNEEK